jgi:hypothetical protein
MGPYNALRMKATCSGLERVIMAWAKCTTDYTDESGDELWYAVDALTSANIAAKFDVPVRLIQVMLSEPRVELLAGGGSTPAILHL